MTQSPAKTSDSLPVRVLVLDDESTIRQLYNVRLTDYGCLVETATNGREALQILMQQGFDVLIVDLKMQGMDGIVFLQEALKIWPWLGVVIVSGYVTAEAIENAKKLGIDQIVEKPINLDKLCQIVVHEARTKRDGQADMRSGNALALMRSNLMVLSQVAEGAMGTDTLAGALLEFSKALSRMLPSDVMGILGVEEKDRILLLTPQSDVTSEFLSSVEKEVLARYEALSGRTVDRSALRIHVEGRRGSPIGMNCVAHSVSVPIILGQEVCGLLTLATGRPEPYKPTDISLLYHAANHISAVFMALRKMHLLATKDPLTGIYNRIRIDEELERAWLYARRYGASMALVIIDLDRFKSANDDYGHPVGDEILREFTALMQNAVRSTDIIGRYGGDEFVAILPQAEERHALAFSERLIESVRQHIFCKSSHSLHLTISVGVAASTNPTAPATSVALRNQADRALYTAKRSGGNRICVWPEQLATVSEREISAEAAAPTSAAATPAAAPSRGSIVIVDDEAPIRELLRDMLSREGFELTLFPAAADAIEAIKAHVGRFDMLLTDISLPGMSGIELLREVGAADDAIVKVVMTGHATLDVAIDCLREGAYDFIQKPVGLEPLLALVRRALELRDLKQERARHQAYLEEMVRRRSAQLARSLEDIRKSYDFTLVAMVSMLDAREHQTGSHSLRARELALCLARAVGVDEEGLDVVAHGALLHDIGKIAIPDSILLRPGPLLPSEWKKMKEHPEVGYRILSSSPYLKQAAEIVRAHHERFDGGGYPRGLRGEEICIGARIFAAVDAYDAMRSERVYRSPVSPEDAVTEICRNSGKQFDPDIVKAFVVAQPEMELFLRDFSAPDANLLGRLAGG